MRKRIVAMLLTVALLMGVLPIGAVQSGRPGKSGNGAAALLHQNLEIRTELGHKAPTFCKIVLTRALTQVALFSSLR